MAEFSSTFGRCVDDNFFENASGRLLAFDHNFSTDWVCENVPVELCYAAGNALLRFQCPVTCGCRDPRSAQYLNGPTFGCPWKACTSSDEHNEALEMISCAVANSTEMEVDANWVTLIDNMLRVGEDLGVDWSEEHAGFTAEGCAFILRSESNFCTGSGEFLSFSRWCPVECGCRAPVPARAVDFNPSLCPPGCELWREQYELQLSQLPCVDGTMADFTNDSSFLALHLETFYHVFALESNTTAQLGEQGCDMFADGFQHMCGFPYYMRGVCPVSCGCADDPTAYACRLSCTNM